MSTTEKYFRVGNGLQFPDGTYVTTADGLVGATGATGPQGDKGDKGDMGDQGLQGATGATGPQGDQGLQGATGSTGPLGLSSSVFNYITGTKFAWGEPASGHILYNAGDYNATPPGGSHILGVSTVNANGVDATNYLSNLRVGQQIIINDASNSANYQIYVVTAAPTIEAGSTAWAYIPVDPVDMGGTGYNGFNEGTPSVFSIQPMVGATGPQGPQGDMGNDGATGATGPQGDKGDKGDTGNDGATGATGPQGPAGANGTSVTIIGTVPSYIDDATLNAIFDTAVAGNGVIAEDTGHLWVYSGSTVWADVGQVKGDQGNQGATGATGPQGDKGDMGDQGATGATGPQGDKGDKGDMGDKGDKGDMGDQGIPGTFPSPMNSTANASLDIVLTTGGLPYTADYGVYANPLTGIIQAGGYVAAEGSGATNGYAFSESAQDTGMYSSGDGNINFYNNAVETVVATSAGWQFQQQVQAPKVYIPEGDSDVTRDIIDGDSVKVSTFYSSAITGTSIVPLSQIPAGTYTTVKYLIQAIDTASGTTRIHSQEMTCVYANGDLFETEYGIIYSDASLGDFNNVISGSNIVLRYTPANDITSVNIVVYITSIAA
jgi:hypothetical protein